MAACRDSFQFCGAFDGRVVLKGIHDFRHPRSELDADSARFQPSRDRLFVVAAAVGRFSRRAVFAGLAERGPPARRRAAGRGPDKPAVN